MILVKALSTAAVCIASYMGACWLFGVAPEFAGVAAAIGMTALIRTFQ